MNTKALLAHADAAEAEISAGTLPSRVQLLVDGIRELAPGTASPALPHHD